MIMVHFHFFLPMQGQWGNVSLNKSPSLNWENDLLDWINANVCRCTLWPLLSVLYLGLKCCNLAHIFFAKGVMCFALFGLHCLYYTWVWNEATQPEFPSPKLLCVLHSFAIIVCAIPGFEIMQLSPNFLCWSSHVFCTLGHYCLGLKWRNSA